MPPENPLTFTRVLAEEFAQLREGPIVVSKTDGRERTYFEEFKDTEKMREKEMLSEENAEKQAELLTQQLDRQAELLQKMSQQEVPLSALCISGGGIRSATFALGAIQGLADLGILEKFDYLSTVSGGGYIGSWLTAWKERRRKDGGTKSIIPALQSSAGPVPEGQLDPIQHLREYNNYLSPKMGLFSADTWTLVATVARNILLNWLVFIPLLMFGLMLPRIVLSLAELGDIYGKSWATTATMSFSFIKFDPEHILGYVGGLLFFLGILNVLRYLPSLGNQPHTEGDFLKFCLAPLLLAAITVLTMDSWFTGGDQHKPPDISFLEWFRGIGAAGGAAWIAYLIFDRKDIRKKWKRILGFTVALLFTALSLAGAAWLLAEHFREMSWSVYVTVALPMFLLAFAGAVTLFVGLTSIVLKDEDREWLARGGAWVLLAVLTWLGLCALVILAPEWAFHISARAESALAAAGGLSGFIAALAGYSNKTKAQNTNGQQAAEAGSKPETDKSSVLLDLAGKLATPIFIVVFLIALVLLTNVMISKSAHFWKSEAFKLDPNMLWQKVSDTPSASPTPANWKSNNTSYAMGELVNFNGHVYRCIQDHKSRAGREPNQPSLWKQADWQENIVYDAGAVVWFNSVEYKGNEKHTSQAGWEPGHAPDPVPWWEHKELIEYTPPVVAAILAAAFLVFSWLMALTININKFSLQAMYRSRLIRAYLGASNPDPDMSDMTGFARNDNLLMSELAPESAPVLKPFHVVNMALNLVEGKRLAWQQRKAESFTVSPLHCGYDNSYRPADGFGGGISLGTAVAISGAAASPNMGYHSSPAMTFIMTLFNARLGSWLGNPKQKKWRHEGPKSAFNSIVREAFGLTNDASPYVYLSDGGHFENLALYEMVRRRCRYIIVLDGGADPEYTYEDLGNALRKIRIDLKVSIEFTPPFREQLGKPEKDSSKEPRNRCAIAEIRYRELDPAMENGFLIYIKPVVLGNESPDVIAYKTANPDFPHQTTADQWFDESQTESYRMLGLWSITDIFQKWEDKGEFKTLVANAEHYLKAEQKARAASANQQRGTLAAEAAERRSAEAGKRRAAAAAHS